MIRGTDGDPMKICFFHLMPYRFLPDDFETRHRSVWVDVPHSLYDLEKTRGLYHEYLDELELAEQCGFDGLCVNEPHKKVVYGEERQRRIKGAALKLLPGGHMMLHESPQTAATAITEFLS